MAKPIGWRRVRRYTAEFKLQAVKLTKVEGVKVGDVAEALDIHPWMLSGWRTQASKGLIKARTSLPKEVRKPKKSGAEMDAYSRLKRSHTALGRTTVTYLVGLALCALLCSCSLFASTKEAKACVPSVRTYALKSTALTPADREIIEKQEPTIAHANYVVFYFSWRDPSNRQIAQIETSAPPQCEPHQSSATN
jgi:transposase